MERWSVFVAEHPWRVIFLWVVTIILAVMAVRSWGGSLTDSFTVPGTESQAALDLLVERYPARSGSELVAVFHRADGSIRDPEVQRAMSEFARNARSVDEVAVVDLPDARPGSVSPDGRTAIVRVLFDKQANNVDTEHIGDVIRLGERYRADGLQIDFGGEPVREYETEPPGTSELVGLGAALLILIIAFGSIFAAGMPVVSALVGLGVGTVGVLLAAAYLDISTIAPTFGAMLGIGVGIDYALFVIARYREQLAAGVDPREAVRASVTTAGRAVAFAGSIVVVALLGLFAIGIPLIANLGLSAALVVLLEMLVAVSLLPAMLVLIGRRIDRFSIPRLRYTAGGEHGRWYRFSRRIERRPWLFLVIASGILIAFMVPAFDIEMGVSDDGNRPTSYTSRRAYDLIANGFGPGVNGTLVAVVDNPTRELRSAELERARQALLEDPGVAAVLPANLSENGETALIPVIPTTAPQQVETRELVSRLRESAVPQALQSASADTRILIAGSTAAFEDVTNKLVSRLPYFFVIVIGVSVLLLMMAFRSIVVPLKAALMNMLAIGASIGFIVAIFQWGWGLSLIGLDRTGPIESFLPMFMFALLFGLSMDYEIFLLSRIREHWLETGDSGESVAFGIGASARVITAAAAILIAVFGSFAFFGDERAVKEFGMGMAFAIFIDATLVRLVLVPAFMQIAGPANWYMPRWLDNALPGLTIDPPIPVRTRVRRMIGIALHMVLARPQKSALR
ncbi:MAG: MMPL family transporter [Chloroflexota bacterium]|nr:MMPL family transporter [Chloroflexota bacterium]MDE2895409.1 MMPL family transporter [Chloroflexota bacterium]